MKWFRRQRPTWDIDLDTPPQGRHRCGSNCATWTVAELWSHHLPHECSHFFRSNGRCPIREHHS